jgi:hypothetical protein
MLDKLNAAIVTCVSDTVVFFIFRRIPDADFAAVDLIVVGWGVVFVAELEHSRSISGRPDE